MISQNQAPKLGAVGHMGDHMATSRAQKGLRLKKSTVGLTSGGQIGLCDHFKTQNKTNPKHARSITQWLHVIITQN
jgi:hypothetical protein